MANYTDSELLEFLEEIQDYIYELQNVSDYKKAVRLCECYDNERFFELQLLDALSDLEGVLLEVDHVLIKAIEFIEEDENKIK